MDSRVKQEPLTFDRIDSFDFLRAVMMSLGIVLHSAQVYLQMPILDYYWDDSRSYSMDALLILINTFRMPVFFMVSGFFTAMLLCRYGFHGMMRNRFSRIVLPFIIFLPPLAVIMSGLRIVAFNLMETGEMGFDMRYLDEGSRLWDNTHNLWFLYYICMFILTTGLIVKIAEYCKPWSLITAFFSNLNILSTAPIVLTALLLGLIGSLETTGRISASLSFVPSIKTFLYFFLCYLFGFLLYARRLDIKKLDKKCWFYLLAAIFFLGVALAGFVFQGDQTSQHYLLFHALLSIGTGFSVVFFMLGFLATFNRYFSRKHKYIRKLSDASYWIFIFHSVPLVIVALAISQWNVVAELKFLIVCLSTFFICTVTYQYWVKGTWIGTLLNGKSQ